MASVRKNSWAWTGIGVEERERDERVEAIQKAVDAQRVKFEAVQLIAVEPKPVAPKPYVPITYTPVSASLNGYTEEQIREYSELANLVGVSPADLKVEEFKSYLSTLEFPVYDLATVVAFMDAKSKAEGKGWGWNWVPLRDKDRIPARFGTQATRREPDWGRNMMGGASERWIGEDRPASDSYESARHVGNGQVVSASIYDKVVPLHALKKIAKIEKEFKGDVAFMVSDYAPAPAFKADPFLMAVINNSRLQTGEGRFVIDVWDEPGFGIDKMLKSGL